VPQQIYKLSCEDAIAFLCEANWGFAEVAVDGTFIWLNQAYCQALNAPLDLILGTNFRVWTHPDDVKIDSELAQKVASGEITCYTLAKRYLQRGSTKTNQRIIWGMLSVQGKYSTTGECVGYRVQYRPYEDFPKSLDYLARIKVILEWTNQNWKLIATVIAVSSTLAFGGSETLLELLKKIQSTTESVESVLPASQSGASPHQ